MYLADGTSLDVLGRGEVHIKTSLGVWKLKEVRYIPGLTKQLISVGQLDREGYHVTFVRNTWKVAKGSLVVAKGERTGTLYLVSSLDELNFVKEKSDGNLWHKRMGHLGEKGLKALHNDGKFPNLNSVNLEFCENCIFGKQRAVKFSKTGREPRQQILELVHTDVWGPAPVCSNGGSKYFVTFIDDHSRKVWLYCIKKKSDVFSVFKKWKQEVENQVDVKIKKLRSDNGGEYDSVEFKLFLEENGIIMQRTVPGTPQQNGIAERMNQTLCERARSMRLNSGLPKEFWAEAVSTAAYLINRSPSAPLKMKVPQEVWTGKKATYDHLKVFGCASYILKSKEVRDKLDSKSEKVYFIGYGQNELGYRFWNFKTNQIVRARNAVFDESKLYKNREDKIKEHSEVTIDLDDVDGPNQVAHEGSRISESYIPEQADSETSEIEGENPEIDSDDREVALQQNLEDLESEIQDGRRTDHFVRRSRRVTRKPDRFDPSLHFLLLTDEGEPESYSEAVKHTDAKKWEFAMAEEMKSLNQNKTWKLTTLPKGKKILQNKWVYRIKEDAEGKPKYKARLVVKGFQQVQNLDYTEVFSPVVKMTTIRLL